MDDTGLNFDAERCDTCGLCVAACPHEALSVSAPVAMLTPKPQPRVLMACDRSAHGQPVPGSRGAHAPGVTACLHSLSPVWLWEQAQQHQTQELLLLAGSCTQCQRRPEQLLHTRWQAWVDRADGANQPSPRLTWATSAQWSLAVHQAKPLIPARRKLLFRLMPGPAASESDPNKQVLTSGRRAATAHLNQRTAGTQSVPPLWQVTLDARLCNWCLACLRLCPTQAMRLSVAEDQVRGLLSLNSNQCTGCGLCTDVCDVNAIEISEPVGTDQPVAGQRWRLRKHVCGACRTACWQWADTPTRETDSLCHACRSGKPHKQHRIIDHGSADHAMAPAHAPCTTQPMG